MKAAQLYKILDAQLGPWFGPAGFKRWRRGQLGYERNTAGRVFTVSFQCDKWGWDAYAGSKFFVSLGVADAAAVSRREERLNYFLTDPELDEARALHDEVVARIPKPPDEYWAQMTAAFSRHSSDAVGLVKALQAQFEPEPLPYRRHQDFALRYWQEADVVGWARYLLRVMPRATAEMTGWTGQERGGRIG